FAWVVGALTLALFAFLAATYLPLETRDPALRDDFRRRGLLAGGVTGVLALGALALARSGAPGLWSALVERPWSLPFHGATAAVALAALAALARRAWRAARLLAALQVTLVLWGWAFAQFPYVLPP